MKTDFLSDLKGKKILVFQKDNFMKFGILDDFDECFIYLKFNDGRTAAIAKSFIIEIKEDTHE
jgi:hypothetical protein